MDRASRGSLCETDNHVTISETEGPFDVDEDASVYVFADDDTQIMAFDGLPALELVDPETDLSRPEDDQTLSEPDTSDTDGGLSRAEEALPDLSSVFSDDQVAPTAPTPVGDESVEGPGVGADPSPEALSKDDKPLGPVGETEEAAPQSLEIADSESFLPRRSAGGFEGRSGVPRHPINSQQRSETCQETKMLDIDFEVLVQSLEQTRVVLEKGLESADIFDSATGLSLVGINSNPVACALLTENSVGLGQALETLGHGNGRYHLIELSNNKVIVVIWHGADLLEAWTLNLERINLGLLFAIAIPQALAAVERARPKV